MSSAAASQADLTSPTQWHSVASISQVLPIVLVLYSFLLLPPEVSVTISGLAFPAYRMVILPIAFFLLLSGARRKSRFSFPDLMVLGACSWTLLAFTHHFGIGSGMISASGIAVDVMGSYFIARSCVRSTTDLRVFLILIAPGLLFAGLMMLIESYTHSVILRQAAANVFGSRSVYSGSEVAGSLQLTNEVRLGLMRAYGPFSHPILGGVLLGSALSLYALSGLRSWPRFVGLLAAPLGFFSLSSAAVMCLMFGIGLIVADKIIRPIKGVSWWLVSGFIFLIAAFLEAASKGGLVNVLIRLTLNPQTGHWRKAIWEYGLASIGRNPLYGIEFQPFVRPDWMGSASVDAHFLAQGVRDGVVTPILMLTAFIYTVIWLGRRVANSARADRDTLFAVNVSLVVLVLSGMTVTYFAESQIWLMTILGVGVSLAQFSAKPVASENRQFPPLSRDQKSYEVRNAVIEK